MKFKALLALVLALPLLAHAAANSLLIPHRDPTDTFNITTIMDTPVTPASATAGTFTIGAVEQTAG